MNRFLPRDADAREAYEELERLQGEGNEPEIIAFMVCHNKSIARVYDLGVGRALLVGSSWSNRHRPSIIGGGEPPRPAERLWPTIEASLPEQEPGDAFEETRHIPTRCHAGHAVLVPRSEVREAVQKYRRSGQVVTMILRSHSEASIAVLDSVK